MSSSPLGPLIPEKYFDIPSQRLYALSFVLLVQAIKVFDFFQYLFSNSPEAFGRKWLIVDLLLCFGLSQLRIPRINYSKSIVILQVLGLWFVDGLLFGGVQLHLFQQSSRSAIDAYSSSSGFGFSTLLSIFTLGLLSSERRGASDSHLLGQHTVRMSPISTARLNPFDQIFCLPSPSSHVLVPVLLNNTVPTQLRYNITPLGYVEGSGSKSKIETFTLHSRDLKAIEDARTKGLQLVKSSASKVSDYEYDEYDDDEQDDAGDSSASRLQKTQSLVHIKVNKPGTIELFEVRDASAQARIHRPSSRVTVTPCPRAEFFDGDVIDKGDNVRCGVPTGNSVIAEDKDVHLDLKIYGVPPLTLKWYKEVNGKREYSLVEGIEDEHTHRSGTATMSTWPAPQEIRVPLMVSAEALGTHVYALESVTDALGNVELVAPPSSALVHKTSNAGLVAEASTKTSRTLHVLRRPTMSFRGCLAGKPKSMRIGSDVTLSAYAHEADALDAPLDVKIKYQPPTATKEERKSKKLPSSWQKTYTTKGEDKKIDVVADAPGEYTIVDVRGKYCEGDVLSPETCTVVELPKPTADIDLRRIHECSGDTGVAASLVLHGTPPFQVYYRMQRNKEHPREAHEVFQGSRGELTLQPPRSGRYLYTFTHISDANYRKVELDGPTIDQVVHPLATAHFVQAGVRGREKATVNSCSGDKVDVEVELDGSAPWDLEVQVVGPKGLEIKSFKGIDSKRKTLQIPVPDIVNKNGGGFEIDLVSVEDSSKCKRTLTVPGISVNVRRVKPTAKFYGKKDKRKMTILEGETAELPLRLTGDGPWKLRYQEESGSRHVAELTSANDHLRVKQKGLYEILEIHDSQCPGTVSPDESTYLVDWVPRPSARLAPDTKAIYEPYNNSHILPPICEGQSAHVDLDLTGRSPFQIMYNIARASETGGTKLIDQPTFNSIQTRTRFQLNTLEPGRIYYEVKQVGDVSYPLAKNKAAIIPRSDRPLFEQEVLARPSARFKNSNKLTYCLHDAFVPLDSYSSDGTVILEGTPPFELKLSIKSLATSAVDTQTVTVNEANWRLRLPDYSFVSVGKHIVTIESIADASHCEETVPELRERSIWVDVAESAAIVPFDRREHFCVGEVAQFQLEGIPPWTIGYRLNTKSHTAEARVSPYSLTLQQPGEFKITSIAHQHKMCKAAVTDLTYTVHQLPSAQVGHGGYYYDDIHEGDQANITFTLIGEPPFTFTYQRAEPAAKKDGRPGKVLETHTVSGVTTQEYHIFSAMEGTWTVTFISDKYCRYPQSPVDGTVQKRS